MIYLKSETLLSKWEKKLRRNQMKRINNIEQIMASDTINDLLNQGYEIDIKSKYGNGIFRLEKAEDEKHIGTTINFDTLEENQPKEPHVRIEFDDIRGVPDVWIDGVKIGLNNDKPLVNLNIDWETNGVAFGHKHFDISYIDLDEDGGGMRKGIREGSLA